MNFAGKISLQVVSTSLLSEKCKVSSLKDKTDLKCLQWPSACQKNYWHGKYLMSKRNSLQGRMKWAFKDSTPQKDSASWEHWKRRQSSIRHTFHLSPWFHLHKAWGKTRWALNNVWLGTIIHQSYRLHFRMRHGRENKQGHASWS